MPDQSRESEKQILTVTKDVEHLQYVINELEKECDFVKKHFTTKNTERLTEIRTIHGRIDKHLQTDLEFHEITVVLPNENAKSLVNNKLAITSLSDQGSYNLSNKSLN